MVCITRLRLGVFCVALALLIAGCGSDENTLTQPGISSQNNAGVVRGEIATGMLAFEYVSDAAGDPGAPIPGPFIIRGRNLHYEGELDALVVDLTVTNATENNLDEPVSLTFLRLLPSEVTVLNADNDETGAGAAFVCEFENTDGVWTPGEESLPRTVQFGVAPGTSIGFVVRIDVSLNPQGGTIGGIVWHDQNEDGLLDPGEAGIPDVGIALYRGATGDGNGDGAMWMTTTAEDGTYRFDGLAAGHYTAVRLVRADLEPTTATEMQVLLVEEDGGVSDFLMANFGCRIVDVPGDVIDVGDCVHAKGVYASEPDRLIAQEVCLCDWYGDGDWDDDDWGDDGDDDCDDDEDEDDEDDDGDDDDKCCPGCQGRLIGPVTEIDLEGSALAVMGTWVHFEDKHDLDLDEVEVGDRIRVHIEVVSGDEGDYLRGCRLKSWHGNHDRVRGPVQEIVRDDEDHITGLRILNTMIEIPAGVGCDDCSR